MAELVIGRTQAFDAEAEIQRKSLAGAVVVLHKGSPGGNAIVVIPRSAAGFAEEGGTSQETLEIRAHRGWREEHQPVVSHRQGAAHGYTVQFSTNPQLMCALGPAQRIQPHEIIRQRVLQLRRVRPKRPTAKLQAVHIGIALRAGGRRQIDSQLGPGYRRLVVQLVADDVDAEAKFVH